MCRRSELEYRLSMAPGWAAWMLLLAVLAGCARTLPVQRPAIGDPAKTVSSTRYHDCLNYLESLDTTVRLAGVSDAQALPVTDFRYLRTDRPTASFAASAAHGRSFDAWVDRMMELADNGRRIEIANLGQPHQAQLRQQRPLWLAQLQPSDAAARCAELLRRIDLRLAQNRTALRRNAAQVPTAYQRWKRVAGVYYVSVWPVALGVTRWQNQTRALYAKPLDRLPVAGRLIRFEPPPAPAPLAPDQVAAIVARSRDALGVPRPANEDRKRLFAAFAPRLEIDVVTLNDHIGRVRWPVDGGLADVDTAHPTVYRHLSHTRLDGRVLLQLNYVSWFRSRPRSSTFDILSGHLDGIVWRVTLGDDGRPVLFDSIHACGCYHLYFPTPGVQVITRSEALQEDTLIAQTVAREGPWTLRVAHTSHYLQRVHTGPAKRAVDAGAVTYDFADYDELRSLPLTDGNRRSLFRADGLVAGSERGERFILWPMGVPSPGAMRQWGHHATAFVGRRHFDDAFLYQGHFRLPQSRH